MSCAYYEHGDCLKKPKGLVGIFNRKITYHLCKYDSVVWVGNQAFAGRVEDLVKNKSDCPFYIKEEK